ncbi:MAG: hypothetical protein GAK32_02377 [Pseudomonas fluorescens]|nr:MAG: hypothetical protein GAK32_02377 [Pseudomonas fluorescens]
MISFKSLQTHLEHNFTRNQGSTDEAALDAEDTASPEDFRAFADAAQKMATTTSVMNEGLRAQHGITKSIFDGIQ